MPLLPTLIFAFAASLLLALFITATQSLHGRYTLDGHAGVQKLHRRPTPRVGGLALAAGAAAGASTLQGEAAALATAFFAASVPAFLSGLLEDVTKRVGAGFRLMATILAGAIFVWLSGYAITKVDLPGADWLLAIPAFSFLFTAIAIGESPMRSISSMA
jgi:UDP-N-acetylmuramyl pentapeptide phosphotransferase/UDP-N-acetylglucosamine-1-phosphate transferase